VHQAAFCAQCFTARYERECAAEIKKAVHSTDKDKNKRVLVVVDGSIGSCALYSACKKRHNRVIEYTYCTVHDDSTVKIIDKDNGRAYRDSRAVSTQARAVQILSTYAAQNGYSAVLFGMHGVEVAQTLLMMLRTDTIHEYTDVFCTQNGVVLCYPFYSVPCNSVAYYCYVQNMLIEPVYRNKSTKIEQEKTAAQKAKEIGKWIASAAQETQRKYKKEKQDIARKREMMQSTIAQLKEENARLLEERQRLALETEKEEEEIQSIKNEQAAIHKRVQSAKAKYSTVQSTLHAQSSELVHLRKTLKQEEEQAEKEAEEAEQKIKYYEQKQLLQITPTAGGCVSFVFDVYGTQHHFSIELNDTYVIHKASIEEKKYKKILDELQHTQDLFEFIKQMKGVFVQHEKERKK